MTALSFYAVGFCITEDARVCHFICTCSQSTIIFLLGNVTEPSTPSSCSTWKITNLKCAYEPKTPTDRAAAHSRIPLRDFRLDFFDIWCQIIYLNKEETIKLKEIIHLKCFQIFKSTLFEDLDGFCQKFCKISAPYM